MLEGFISNSILNAPDFFVVKYIHGLTCLRGKLIIKSYSQDENLNQSTEI